jgi:hypothetical protein
MDKLYRFTGPWLGRLALPLAALLLGLASAAATAQAPDTDPPGRVANLSWRDGGVVFAPAGEDEWIDLPVNRPLTRGDRLWTDKGARAELHLGSATLQVDDETHLGVTELDDEDAQLILMQGSLNARVRELDSGENFEVDTPNLALRALTPGDYRVDVSPQGVTRVTVRSGRATVYGEGGNAIELAAGQEMTFSGRNLARASDPFGPRDGFDRWAAERNQREDQSLAARHLPRAVVGYSQLDTHGSWDTVAEYGTVWYPRVTVADWAPYRYGHWSWIAPWGWTWIDDAPWGFAPFHYGRWAQIGSRWAWVPGRIGPRPIYAPALVAFVGGVGGSSSWSLTLGSSPGIAWYPLGPGEAWRPSYRTSTVYLSNLNRHYSWRDRDHAYRRHAWAVTAVPLDDFRRGRPVHDRWQRVRPEAIAQAPLVQQLPQRIARGEWRGDRPRLAAQPPSATMPWSGGRRDFANERWRTEREQGRVQRESRRGQEAVPLQGGRDVQESVERQQRQQQAAREMQERQRQQHDVRQQQDRAEREARQQQQQQSVREMQERQRQQHDARQQQDRTEREARQQQQQQAVRAMQERQQQEQAARMQERQQQEHRMRQQQEFQQRAQERQQHEQAVRAMQERRQQEQASRMQERQQQEHRIRQQQEFQQRQQHEQAARAMQERQQQEHRIRQQQEFQQRQQHEQAARAMQERQQHEQRLRHQQETVQRAQQRQQQVQAAPQAQPQVQDGGSRLRGRGPRGDDDEGPRGRGPGRS